MGVKYLKSFIESNDDILIKRYRLSNGYVVIDANNFKTQVFVKSQGNQRGDLFGGDMVKFASFTRKVLENFQSCNITPIFVYDGAKNEADVCIDKTATQYQRSRDRFNLTLKIGQFGHGRFIKPDHTTCVFNSVILDKGMKIVTCMFEADLEIARLANQFRCAVISNDSDFLLMDLKFGQIMIDSLEFTKVFKQPGIVKDGKSQLYLECSLYRRDRFVQFFPDLDPKCLPLLAILSGNDFVRGSAFEDLCKLLPVANLSENFGRQMKLQMGPHLSKILKILYFLCGKTVEQAINQICQKVAQDKRKELKEFIQSNLKAYEIPVDDHFDREMIKLCKPGFLMAHQNLIDNKEALEREFNIAIRTLIEWIRECTERSILSPKILEIAHRNILFLQPTIDDNSLDSSRETHYAILRVLLNLTRTHHKDYTPLTIMDRVRKSYDRVRIDPKRSLEKFGPIDFLFYEIPNLPDDIRRAIALATINCSMEEYEDKIVFYHEWLDPVHAEQFFLVKVILDFIDRESKVVKLWKQLRQATLLTMLYYFVTDEDDLTLKCRPEGDIVNKFMNAFCFAVKRQGYTNMPRLSRMRRYNQRLMHQISQLQSAVNSFNQLNAFLGDTLVHLKTGSWMNSCLIYNLADNMKSRRLAFEQVPDFVNKPLNLK